MAPFFSSSKHLAPVDISPLEPRFWEKKPLSQMNAREWELICDTCGKCCLHKLQEEDTGDLYYTNVACQLLDLASGQCSDYEGRQKIVPDCVKLTCQQLKTIRWLPATCAYRLLAEGQPLPPWHPLETGSQNSVHTSKMSVRGRAISEDDAFSIEDHIVDWDDL